MKIEARITALVGDEKLKAYASVCLDDEFLIKGIKVIDGIHGRFVAMPSRKSKHGEHLDVCFPIVKELREKINAAVLEAYRKKMEEM